MENSLENLQTKRSGDRWAHLLFVVHGDLDEDHGEGGVDDGLPLVDLLGPAAEEPHVEADDADEGLLHYLHCQYYQAERNGHPQYGNQRVESQPPHGRLNGGKREQALCLGRSISIEWSSSSCSSSGEQEERE